MKLLLSDLRAKQRLHSSHGQPCSLLKAVVSDGTLAGALFRMQAALVRWRLVPLALLPHVLNKWINGCVIGVRAQFGPGFLLCHPVGVVINSSVLGGSNVWLESGVVLGENRGRSPRLGDDIYVGAGAKVIGGLVVGNGVKIGANAVLLEDAPDGAVMVGIPARRVR